MKDIKCINLCYFSPCGNVKKVVNAIKDGFLKVCSLPVKEYDFTLLKKREKELSFGENDMVIIGTPVYAGRVPNKIIPYISEKIKGNNTCCICAVAFGNRAFDDALSELYFTMNNNGFCVTGAMAAVSEHSFASTLATSRPDETDIDKIKQFGISVAEKMQNDMDTFKTLNIPGEIPPKEYYTPLKEDLSPAKFLKAVPCVDKDKCKNCKKCVNVCPMASIDYEDVSVMNNICIKCQACIKACPENARYFDNEDFFSHRKMLMDNHSSRKESFFAY